MPLRPERCLLAYHSTCNAFFMSLSVPSIVSRLFSAGGMWWLSFITQIICIFIVAIYFDCAFWTVVDLYCCVMSWYSWKQSVISTYFTFKCNSLRDLIFVDFVVSMSSKIWLALCFTIGKLGEKQLILTNKTMKSQSLKIIYAYIVIEITGGGQCHLFPLMQYAWVPIHSNTQEQKKLKFHGSQS